MDNRDPDQSSPLPGSFDLGLIVLRRVESDWVFETVNEPAVGLIGLSARAMIGRTLEDVLGTTYAAELLPYLAASVQTSRSHALPGLRFRADRPSVSVCAIPIDSSRVGVVIATEGISEMVLPGRAFTPTGRVKDPSSPPGPDRSSDEPEERGSLDVTERPVLERRLEEANRLTSLGRLAATIAHEFNNVLMAIQPFAEVIVRVAGDERVERAGKSIIGSVQKGRRITREILQFTRPAQPVKTRIDVREWINQIAPELRELLSASIKLKVNFEHADLTMMGDRNQLSQVLTSLAGNARDAMPNGGTLYLDVRILSPSGANHPASLSSNKIEIVVRDTGTGIHPEALTHVFDPFFTTRTGRTGLGLSIALQAIRLHEGTIEIESQPGVGTAFHLLLPEARTAAAETPLREERVQSLVKKRILLVEDEPSVAAGIRSMLESAGSSVRSVTRGTETVPAIEEELPDAVLLDLVLPDMHGAEVYRQLAENWPSLPVVFSTGRAERADLESFLANPHVGFLKKPYDSESLVAELNRVLSSR